MSKGLRTVPRLSPPKIRKEILEWERVSVVARRCRIGQRTVRRWAEEGRLPVQQPGGVGTMYLVHYPTVLNILRDAREGVGLPQEQVVRQLCGILGRLPCPRAKSEHCLYGRDGRLVAEMADFYEKAE